MIKQVATVAIPVIGRAVLNPSEGHLEEVRMASGIRADRKTTVYSNESYST